MVRQISQRKLDFRARLESYLRDYKTILIVNVDMVGSNQMQQVRLALRGRAVISMGKNTVIRMVLRNLLEEHPEYEGLLEVVNGNVGFIFTNEDPSDIRTVVAANQVPAAARVGVVAGVDVYIPAGPTGLDPGQTSFFQAMNIATKIVRGTIELQQQVHLVRKGDKVSASAVSLLNKLNMKPFSYAMNVQHVFDDGAIFDASVLDMTDAILEGKFFNAVSKLTCVSLAIGYPTQSSVPHSMVRGFKKLLALALETKIEFKEAKKYKLFYDDPEAFKAEFGSAVAAAPAAAAGGAAAPAAAAAPEPEEESEEEDMDFDLFG